MKPGRGFLKFLFVSYKICFFTKKKHLKGSPNRRDETSSFKYQFLNKYSWLEGYLLIDLKFNVPEINLYILICFFWIFFGGLKWKICNSKRKKNVWNWVLHFEIKRYILFFKLSVCLNYTLILYKDIYILLLLI